MGVTKERKENAARRRPLSEGRLHYRHPMKGLSAFTLCEMCFAHPPTRITANWRAVTCLDCAVDLAAAPVGGMTAADAFAHFPDVLGLTRDEFVDEVKLNFDDFKIPNSETDIRGSSQQSA